MLSYIILTVYHQSVRCTLTCTINAQMISEKYEILLSPQCEVLSGRLNCCSHLFALSLVHQCNVHTLCGSAMLLVR